MNRYVNIEIEGVAKSRLTVSEEVLKKLTERITDWMKDFPDSNYSLKGEDDWNLATELLWNGMKKFEIGD